jgi:hypothetical protein
LYDCTFCAAAVSNSFHIADFTAGRHFVMRIPNKAWAAVVFCLAVAEFSIANGAPLTVDSLGVLDPNPNTLTMTDALSNTSLGANGVTLANFQTLITSSFAANKGGVLDFQEAFQGGTWPNNPAASPNNGVTVGNSSANAITATYGVSQIPTMSFFRNSATDGIDAAINQGLNVISGGGSTRSGSGTSFWDFTTSPPTSSPGPAGGNIIAAGGGYMGITGAAAVELDFNNGLSAFGITGLPRGATRHTQITLTLSDNSTIVGSNDIVGTSAVFWGFQLTPAQLASGLSITKASFAHPDGVNRYDDLAFVVAVPEPASLALVGVGSLGMVVLGLRSRRSVRIKA